MPEERPLLNCPFCGAIPSLFNDDGTEHGWIADCMHCGCAGFTGRRETVVAKWNKRSQLEQIGECICPKCGLRHGTSARNYDSPF